MLLLLEKMSDCVAPVVSMVLEARVVGRSAGVPTLGSAGPISAAKGGTSLVLRETGPR